MTFMHVCQICDFGIKVPIEKTFFIEVFFFFMHAHSTFSCIQIFNVNQKPI